MEEKVMDEGEGREQKGVGEWEVVVGAKVLGEDSS